jgi:hypothetical protein
VERHDELEATIVRNLQSRGLARVPDRLAFVHDDDVVELAIELSVYTGPQVVVYDGRRKVRHFRARAGAYDWNAIAALIVDTVASRRTPRATPRPSVPQQNERLARDLASIVNAGAGGALAIAPSGAPGRVRVRMPEVDLDPVSVMRLFEVVRDALPASPPLPDATPPL